MHQTMTAMQGDAAEGLARDELLVELRGQLGLLRQENKLLEEKNQEGSEALQQLQEKHTEMASQLKATQEDKTQCLQAMAAMREELSSCAKEVEEAQRVVPPVDIRHRWRLRGTELSCCAAAAAVACGGVVQTSPEQARVGAVDTELCRK